MYSFLNENFTLPATSSYFSRTKSVNLNSASFSMSLLQVNIKSTEIGPLENLK